MSSTVLLSVGSRSIGQQARDYEGAGVNCLTRETLVGATKGGCVTWFCVVVCVCLGVCGSVVSLPVDVSFHFLFNLMSLVPHPSNLIL